MAEIEDKENIDPRRKESKSNHFSDFEKPKEKKHQENREILGEIRKEKDISSINLPQPYPLTKKNSELEKRVLADITKPIVNQMMEIAKKIPPQESFQEIQYVEFPQTSDFLQNLETHQPSVSASVKLPETKKSMTKKNLQILISDPNSEKENIPPTQREFEYLDEDLTEENLVDDSNLKHQSELLDQVPVYYQGSFAATSPTLKSPNCVVAFTIDSYRGRSPTPIITSREITPFSPNAGICKNIFAEYQKSVEFVELKQTSNGLQIPEEVKIDLMELRNNEQEYIQLRMDDWLTSIRLEEFRANFADNGYIHVDKFIKDYHFCNQTFEDLLYRFGIDKVGYRIRIIMKLREGNIVIILINLEECGSLTRKGLFTFSKVYPNMRLEYPSVKEWLTCLGYEEYLQNFIDSGFDDLEFIVLQIGFEERPFDDSILKDEIGIDDYRIRKDMLKRLRISKDYGFLS